MPVAFVDLARPRPSGIAWRLGVATVLALVPAAAAHAQDPDADSPDPPVEELFETELPFPQERGEWQFTLAPRGFQSSTLTSFLAPLAMEYGITDRFEVGLEWGVATRRDRVLGGSVSGLTDVEIEAKYGITGRGFQAAVGFGVTLPVADPEDELGEGAIEYEPGFAIAVPLPGLDGAMVVSQVNLGLVHVVRGDEEGAHEVAARMAAIWPVGPAFLSTEFVWQDNAWNGGDETTFDFTPGVIWGMGDVWEIGAATRFALAHAGPDPNPVLFVSLSFEFGGDADD